MAYFISAASLYCVSTEEGEAGTSEPDSTPDIFFPSPSTNTKCNRPSLVRKRRT